MSKMGEWQNTTIGNQVTLQRGIDITKAQQLLGYGPEVTFAEGLKRTFVYYAAKPRPTS